MTMQRRKRQLPNRGGRPSKFTPGAVAALLGALYGGQSFEVAAKAAGIGPSTLYRWMAKARRGDPQFGPLAGVVDRGRRVRRGRFRVTLADWRAIAKLVRF
jgi:hypothetical protein